VRERLQVHPTDAIAQSFLWSLDLPPFKSSNRDLADACFQVGFAKRVLSIFVNKSQSKPVVLNLFYIS